MLQQGQRWSAATYSQLTEAYIHAGPDATRPRPCSRSSSGCEPQNEQHRNKLEFVRGQAEGRRRRAPRPPRVRPRPPDSASRRTSSSTRSRATSRCLWLTSRPPPRPRRRAGPPRPGRPIIELSGPLSEEDREFIDEHLAEGRVFRKYGLVDKARRPVRGGRRALPRQRRGAPGAARRLPGEGRQAEQAAEQCLALAEICRLKGDSAGADEMAGGSGRRLLPQAAPRPRRRGRHSRGGRPSPYRSRSPERSRSRRWRKRRRRRRRSRSR